MGVVSLFGDIAYQGARSVTGPSKSRDFLAIFDLLKKDKMSKDEEKKVKLAAQSLLKRLV